MENVNMLRIMVYF